MKKTHGEISQDFLQATFKTDREDLERMFELIDRAYDVFGEEIYLDSLSRFMEFIGYDDIDIFEKDDLPIYIGADIVTAAFCRIFNTRDLGEALSGILLDLNHCGRSPNKRLRDFEAILMNQEYLEERKTNFMRKLKQFLK